MGMGQGNISFEGLPIVNGGGLSGFHQFYIPFGDAVGGLEDTIDTGVGQLTWNNGFTAATTNAGLSSFVKINSTSYISTVRAQTDITGTTAKSLFGYGKGFTDYWLTGLDNTSFVIRNALNNWNNLVIQQTFGRIGIGSNNTAPAAPTAMLHIGASSGAANDAPLKLTSGTLLAAPQAGAIEFNNNRLFFTITTGATRKDIALMDSQPGTNFLVVGATNGAVKGSAVSVTGAGLDGLNVPANIIANAISTSADTVLAQAAMLIPTLGGVAIGNTPASTSSYLVIAPGLTAGSQMRLLAGVAPTAPVDGDIWFDGTNLFMRIGGVTKTFTIV